MKLDCELTLELYPQYHDGDLSEGVRKRVEEHLAECSKCREVYGSGNGFKVSSAPVPPALDEKVALGLRVSKLKTMAKMLLIVTLVILYSNYNIKRSYLSQDIQTMEDDFYMIHMSLDAPDSRVYPTWLMVRDANTTLEMLGRNFNWLERSRAGKWDSVRVSSTLSHMMELLQLRRNHDAFTEQDQEAADYIKAQVEFLGHHMEGAGNSFQVGDFGIFRNPFTSLDTKTLANTINDLNSAVFAYYYYSALPGELKPLSDQEFIQRIKQSLPWEDIVVSLDDASGLWNFIAEWEDGEYQVTGIADHYTGDISSLGFGKSSTPGTELMDKDQSVKELTNLLTALYGPEYSFEIQYQGQDSANENYIPRFAHAFSWTPMFQGYRVADYSASYQRARYDAQTSRLDQIHGIWVPDNTADVTVNFSPEQGYDILQLDGHLYEESLVILSALSDTWVLVHKYEIPGTSHTKYLNVVTGAEDFPAQRPPNF